MKKAMTVFSAAALAFAVSMPALAEKGEGQRHGKTHHHERHMERFAKQLDLTEQQRTRIAAIREQHGTALKASHQEIRSTRAALRELSGPQFKEGDVRREADKLGKLTADAAVRHARMRSEISAVLTDEQRAKAAEMREQRKERMQQRWQRGGEKGGRGDYRRSREG